MKKLRRREFLAGVTGAMLGSSPWVTSMARAKVPPVLKMGYIPITDAAPLLVAYSRGLFQKAGIRVKPPVRIAGWSELSMGFASGVFNLAHLLSPIPLFLRYEKKIPVKVVAWDHVNSSAITIKENSDIRDIVDLGGRKIAIPFWYSVHNIILQYSLKERGLKPVVGALAQGRPQKKNEVLLFEMAPPDMVFAMKNNAIDGYIVAEPYNALGEMRYGGRILRFSGDIWKNHACCQAVMHEDLIKAHPGWAQRVVDVIVETELWMNEHLEETAMILSSDGEGFIDVPYSIMKRAMFKYDNKTYGAEGTGAIRHPEWKIRRVGFDPFPFKSYTKKLVELFRKTEIQGDKGFLDAYDSEFIANDLVDYKMIITSLKKVGLSTIEGVDLNTSFERPEIISV
jgi:NitT/TauT family transport system substrate-binding protein